MINKPTPGNFYKISIRYLIQSIDILYRNEKSSLDILNGEITNSEFWKDKQDVVFSSFTLLFLCMENFVKAEICNLSPYLLISTTPSRWSISKSDKKFYFEDQYLHSLKDLVVLYEDIKGHQKKIFEDISSIVTMRNNIIHGLPSEEISPSYIFNIFFNFVDQLWNSDWINRVLKEIDSFDFQGTEFDGSSRLNLYLKYIETYLGEKKIHKLLAISDKKPLYSCPACNHMVLEFLSMDNRYKLSCYAFLQNNDLDCNKLYCSVCQVNYSISREPCIGCDEAVIFNYFDDDKVSCIDSLCLYHNGVCLSCGETQNEEL